MQILLQAMFAENLLDGKKPDTVKLNLLDGENEFFSELLLPETDLYLELPLDPLNIDTDPSSSMRYSSSIEVQVEAETVDPSIAVLSATTEVTLFDNKYDEKTETIVKILKAPEFAKPEQGEHQVDSFSQVSKTALYDGSVKSVPAAPVLVSEVEPTDLKSAPVQRGVIVLEKGIVDHSAIPAPNPKFSSNDKRATGLVSRESLIAESKSPTDISNKMIPETLGRPDVLPITSTEARLPVAMSPPDDAFQNKFGEVPPHSDQTNPNAQRAATLVAAPIETHPSRETQPRSDRREVRGTDRHNARGDIPVAAASLLAAPSVAIAPVTQPTTPFEQRTFGDAGQPTVDGATGLSPRDSEDVRPQTSTLSRVEAAVRPVITQIVHVMTRANLEGMIEIRLSPEELGRVKLTMSQSEVGITVHIMTERQETLDLMRRNIDMLESDLRDQGFQNLSFSFGQHGTASGSEDEAPTDQNEAPSATGLQAEVTPILAPIQDGRLDIRL